MFNKCRLSGLADEAAASIEQQISAHLSLGWKDIEIRSVDGLTLCQMSPQKIQHIVEALSASGIRCDVVGSTLGNWATPITVDFKDELQRAGTLFDYMQTIGATYARIMSYPNDGLTNVEWRDEVFHRISQLCKLAEEAGVILLHENCSGWAGQGPEQTLALLDAVKSPALKLLFDIGNGIAYQYDSVTFLEQIIEYVAHVHIKDAVRSADEVIYCLPGQGDSKVRECLCMLEKNGYSGIFSIEPHLQFIPHLNSKTDASSMSESYIEYARTAEELVANTYG